MVLRFIFTFAFLLGFFAMPALAATPVFDAAISWHSGTTVPAWYAGKALPNMQSPIVASVLMTADNRPVDLRNYTVSWRVNGDGVAAGRGLSRITLDPTTTPAQLLRLQAFITNDAGDTVAKPLVSIERSRPKVVIDAPLPRKEISGEPTTITALPFFFSFADASDFSFDWFIDGVSVSTDRELTVAATENALPAVRIEAQVKNIITALESAKRAITLLPRL